MTLREYLENEKNADIQRVTLYDDTDVTDRCTDNRYEELTKRYFDIMEALADVIGSPEEKRYLQKDAELIAQKLKELENVEV